MGSDPVGQLTGELKLLAGGLDPQAHLDALTAEWKSYFTESQIVQITTDKLNDWKVKAEAYFQSPTRAQELALLKSASEDPLEGLGVVLTSLPAAMGRSVQGWWDTFFGEETEGGYTAGWKIHRFAAPPSSPPPNKFLIISDLHRDDATEDVRGDDRGVFQRGSIDHFKSNVPLYERVLDYAIEGGYTLIEAGDCEELWFVGDVATYPTTNNGTLDVAEKLRRIITSHPTIYSKLRELHGSGRYFRMYGNHDSFLKPDGTDDSVFQVLKTEMEKGLTDKPFQIYDAFVIEGVKSMMEHASLELFTLIAAGLTGQQLPRAIVDQILLGRLGMDSNDYTSRKNLFVTHGHQFDFWNRPENEILGLLNANTVGMVIDRNMDPFLDIRGFASQGNPWIDFADVFAALPFFNSFLSRDQARQVAHQVQHAGKSQRMLSDGLAFSETTAALYGAFGVALDYRDPAGNLITAKKSREDLGLDTWETVTVENVFEYFRRHHLHLISIGHTHVPHSQSYVTFANLLGLTVFLTPLEAVIRFLVPDALEPKFKTTYLNSGTAGWMEGVIWGIEVDETGQARLVYWIENEREAAAKKAAAAEKRDEAVANGRPEPVPEPDPQYPEYMDWELRPFPADHKAQMLQGWNNALDEASAAVSTKLDTIRDQLTRRMNELNLAAEQIAAALQREVVLSIEMLSALILFTVERAGQAYEQLQEVPDALKEYYERATEEFQQQLDKIRSFKTDIMMKVKRRALFGFDASSGTPDVDTFVIRAPISDAERQRLEHYQKLMVLIDVPEDQALHHAGLATAVFGNFPRNMPFFAGFDATNALRQSSSPVLDSLLSTLWMYPPPGQKVVVKGVEITSTFELRNAEVTLTVVLRKETPPDDDSRPNV